VAAKKKRQHDMPLYRGQAKYIRAAVDETNSTEPYLFSTVYIAVDVCVINYHRFWGRFTARSDIQQFYVELIRMYAKARF
jgi:hypothetical protein